jgi:hypothetical protein
VLDADIIPKPSTKIRELSGRRVEATIVRATSTQCIYSLNQAICYICSVGIMVMDRW